MQVPTWTGGRVYSALLTVRLPCPLAWMHHRGICQPQTPACSKPGRCLGTLNPCDCPRLKILHLCARLSRSLPPAPPLGAGGRYNG